MTDSHHISSHTHATVPKVLHVRVMAGSGGGPEKTILRTPRGVDPSQFRVAAAYIHPHGDPGIESLRAEAARLDCPLHTIAERGPLDPRTPARLLKLCRELNVTVWHAHDYKSDALGLLLRTFHPMKLVTTVHGWTDETARVRLYRRIDNWCLRHYDRVMTVSQPIADAVQTIGVDPARLSVIPNGIDLGEFTRTRLTHTAKLTVGLDPSRPTLGVIGRLSVEKGVDRLLIPIAELRNRIPNLQVQIIGDGPQRVELQTIGENLGLESVIHFRGWQSPLQKWYEALDAVVLPSRTEGMPNVVLEAMAMAVPVAATDVGGVRDLLDNGDCGTILAADPHAWSDDLFTLLTKTPRRHRIATAARQHIESQYTFARRIERELAIYADVLGHDSAVTAAPLRRAA